jgi:hypothetical protein
VSDPPEIPVHNWTIRMKHTALDAYPASPSWEGTGWTTVYEGDETIASIGWVTFALSAPFEYDGTSNLMVDFSYRNDDYAFGRRKCYATATSETRSIYDFAISGDPLSWSGTSPLPSKAEKILNIKILMTSGTEVSISPGITPPFENGRWSGEVTVHEEATQMHLQAKGIYGTTGTSNTFDVLPTRELRVKSTPEEVTITGDKPGTTEYSAMCLDGEVVDLMAPEQIEVDSMPYSFVRWVVDLVDQPNGLRDLSVVMDAPHTVEALYRLTRHMLAVQSEPPGMQIGGDKPGTTNYTATCDHGQSVNLLAPEGAIQGQEIYVFKRWLLDGQPHGESQTQLGVLMNEDHTAEAIFDPRFSGDANGDCRVNVLDLIFVRNRLNQDVGTADNWQADVNTDGKINVLDLIYVRNRLNTKCPE